MLGLFCLCNTAVSLASGGENPLWDGIGIFALTCSGSRSPASIFAAESLAMEETQVLIDVWITVYEE
jgi:hypothetical protein